MLEALLIADPDSTWNLSTIYRWDYPIEKNGRGGDVPPKALRAIKKAARLSGVMLYDEDFIPGLR